MYEDDLKYSLKKEMAHKDWSGFSGRQRHPFALKLSKFQTSIANMFKGVFCGKSQAVS